MALDEAVNLLIKVDIFLQEHTSHSFFFFQQTQILDLTVLVCTDLQYGHAFPSGSPPRTSRHDPTSSCSPPNVLRQRTRPLR